MRVLMHQRLPRLVAERYEFAVRPDHRRRAAVGPSAALVLRRAIEHVPAAAHESAKPGWPYGGRGRVSESFHVLELGTRVVAILLGIHRQREAHAVEVGSALDSICVLSRPRQDWQQYADQNGNDSY